MWTHRSLAGTSSHLPSAADGLEPASQAWEDAVTPLPPLLSRASHHGAQTTRSVLGFGQCPLVCAPSWPLLALHFLSEMPPVFPTRLQHCLSTIFSQTLMWLPFYIPFKYLYFILACELSKERVSISTVFVIQHWAQCLHLKHVVDI